MRASPSVSVVIPCYRSEETIGKLISMLHSALDGWEYEVICVVDGSPDQTWTVVAVLAEHPRVRALELMRNYGQHNAVLAGIRAARNDVIVTMDDDLQHSPADVPTLARALDDTVDLVYAVPQREPHGLLRGFASRSMKRVIARSMGVTDARQISAFRAFRTELRSGFDAVRDPFVSIDVLLSWTGSRVRSLPIEMSERDSGQSNYTFGALLRHTVNMVTGYSSAPLRVVTFLGLFTAIVGLVLLLYVLVLYFSGRTQVAGFTTVAAMVAMFSGVQLFALGVLGEYIGRLHSRSISRPSYVVRREIDHE
jgi:undecaprenyl-phosphate 4-deoxy-4-formamido-L-arabinose transferase